MNEPPLTVRRATDADLTVLACFGFALGQLHVGFDGERFAVPPGGESAYAAFFREELQRPEVVLLIAEAGPQAVGYAFVRMEPMSLVELRRAGAWLLEAAKEAALAMGSSSLMLSAASQNAAARKLFERAGLRPTMVEMRIELGT